MENKILSYKGKPLLRIGNLLYYGNMYDKYVVVMQILESKEEGELKMASKISVQLQRTDPSLRASKRIEKSAEKNSLAEAMEYADIWLTRALKA